MITKILKGKQGISEAIKLLSNDELVAFPTETVYGLGANIYSREAVEKIFIAKNRPQDNPLIAHISDFDMLKDLVVEIPEIAKKIMHKFMPGPITLVFKRKKHIDSIVSAGLDTIAVRMPCHKVALDLIASFGKPLVAPSANMSTHVSPTKAEHVYDDLNGRIPLIIDGDISDVGIESTVVDVTTNEIKILRPGIITKKDLEEALDLKIVEEKSTVDKPSCPGMKYKHYAPKKPFEIFANHKDIINKYESIKNTKKCVIICRENIYTDKNVIVLGTDAKSIAQGIYNALREAEKKYDYIISEDFLDDDKGKSIMNRVYKAQNK